MKRRGFTLIELMVVIAIIIILAAIAIPNYLNMTKRAKVSRVQSDMATLATALETFKTDWGSYPSSAAKPGDRINDSTKNVYHELVGDNSGTLNKANAYNALGLQTSATEYLKKGTLDSIVNPFDNASGIMYYAYGTNNSQWCLWCDTKDGSNPIMYRLDSMSNPSYVSASSALP